jgi:hypothetical protein
VTSEYVLDTKGQGAEVFRSSRFRFEQAILKGIIGLKESAILWTQIGDLLARAQAEHPLDDGNSSLLPELTSLFQEPHIVQDILAPIADLLDEQSRASRPAGMHELFAVRVGLADKRPLSSKTTVAHLRNGSPHSDRAVSVAI